MKAARIHEYGPPEVLKVEEAPDPPVGPKDVLIEVYASSVNPIDVKIRSGGQRGIIWYTLPHVLGLDVSGVVKEVGSSVTKFSVGDEVVSSPTHKRSGCYAELVSIDESAVAHKASSISHEEAASLPLVALTAWQGLVDHGGVGPNDKVFVQAGSGGVGSIAIQIAKHFGAEVSATCSTRNVELVQSLGADRVIDYTKEQYDDVLSDQTIVIDNLGFEHRDRAAKIIKSGGRIELNVGGIPAATHKHGKVLGPAVAVGSIAAFTIRSLFRGVKVKNVLRPCDGDKLGQIMTLVDSGALKPLVDRVVPLDDIVEAHRYSETSRARGKIVIGVKSP